MMSALEYRGSSRLVERSPTAWRPPLWPIKIVLCLGVFLMILQALAEFFRDIDYLREGDTDVA